MPKEGSKIRSRFIRKSAKPGAKRKPKSILILGGKKIGKTCLAKRFLNGDFTENHVATVEERYAQDVEFKEYKIHIEVVDIDAFEFPAMRDLCLKEADVVMLAYEVENKKSFDVMKKIYEIMKGVCDYPIPTVIVGTKADKLDSKIMIDGLTDDYVDEFLEEINSERHADQINKIITSAKIGFNVNRAFHLGFEDMVKTMNTASLSTANPLDSQKDGCCVIM